MRILCSDTDHSLNRYCVPHLKSLVNLQSQYKKSESFRHLKQIINNCLALKEQAEFRTADLVSKEFFFDKHDIICRIVEYRASNETKYRQQRNSHLFVTLMDEIHEKYKASEVVAPMS